MIKVLTFFNNKGGVGKTSLAYHLAWIYADLGLNILVADLDPQSNLTAAFLSEDEIAELWDEGKLGTTVFDCVKPLTEIGDIANPILKQCGENLYLLPGHVALSRFEDTLSREWPDSLGSRSLYRPMRILSAFWQVLQMAGNQINADLILVDVGPNLGAINRSVLIATNYVLIPLGADLFSLQGLKNLGPALREWREEWSNRVTHWNKSQVIAEHPDFQLPCGEMKPIGYVCQQPEVRMTRPVTAYRKWVERMPIVYRETVLGLPYDNGEHLLATIKHYRSLVPMAQEHRKPIFKLTAADGAIGSHAQAAQDAKKHFLALAQVINDNMK